MGSCYHGTNERFQWYVGLMLQKEYEMLILEQPEKIIRMDIFYCENIGSGTDVSTVISRLDGTQYGEKLPVKMEPATRRNWYIT